MYKYLYAVGRYKGHMPGFHVVDISRNRVGDLEKLYSILYIVVRDEMLHTDISLLLDDHRLSFSNTPGSSIQEWLTSQANVPLKQAKVKPGKDPLYVKLERIFTNGYFHYPGDVNLTKDRQSELFADSAPDLLVKHYKYSSGIDYRKISDYSLFTVNGVFYRSFGRSDGVYLLGCGFDYIKNRQDLRVGALNFEKLGKITTIPITNDNLIEQDGTGPKRYRIKVTETSLDNKTVWIVINGQLIVDTEMLYRVSNDHMAISPTAFDAMSHYQTYREYCRTPILTDMSKFDKYKKEALLMHNSFLVVIDNPTLGVETIPLANHLYPNVLHTETRFQHPIVLDNGLFPLPYMKSYGIGQRLLNFDLRVVRKYPIQTNGTLGDQRLNDLTVNQGDPGHLAKGFFFKIHGVKFEAV